jgi:hypothetical protein
VALQLAVEPHKLVEEEVECMGLQVVVLVVVTLVQLLELELVYIHQLVVVAAAQSLQPLVVEVV